LAGKSYALNYICNNWLGYILGDFLTNSSGHTDAVPQAFAFKCCVLCMYISSQSRNDVMLNQVNWICSAIVSNFWSLTIFRQKAIIVNLQHNKYTYKRVNNIFFHLCETYTDLTQTRQLYINEAIYLLLIFSI
jgi:hypothetical protein